MNIKRCALLIEAETGLHRISDWAILTVGTDAGPLTLFEPRQNRSALESNRDIFSINLDWSSEDHKITDLLFDTTHNHVKMMSGGGEYQEPLHGGALTPQTGR